MEEKINQTSQKINLEGNDKRDDSWQDQIKR